MPVTSGDHAPSLWSDARRYRDDSGYRDELEAWFVTQMATHTVTELNDRGWCHHDAEILLDHLGRDGLHCAKDRSSITKAWSSTRDEYGHRTPLVWPRERVHLAEYIHFINASYAAVIVIDVDHVGAPGGRLSELSMDVRDQVEKLTRVNLGPNWIGVNPASGKSQMLWYIDPVYKAGEVVSRPWKLLEALHAELQGFFEADKNFSHGWSRNPIYDGDNLGAYRWYAQHHEVFHMRLLSAGLWMLQGESVATLEDKGVKDRRKTQRFSSGRELINAARANTEAARVKAERARQAQEVLAGLEDADLGALFAASDEDVVDGVRVVWQSPGRAQRDVTAFQHALKTAGVLYRSGGKMTDDRIIDAYRQAYEVAQSVGADGRGREEPPMRDLRSLARRVRGYVSGGKGVRQAVAKERPVSVGMNSSERKALSTLGRRGGKKAAERWNDPDSEYTKAQLNKLRKTHRRKQIQGQTTRARIQAFIGEQFIEAGTTPTRREIAEAVGCTPRTVTTHLAALREAGMLPGS
ncbi:replication initiation protein [Corynebacterium alimapuense]|uniref:replication initiation protein n=1 Tax=Corynebacterium alimapuense TaxID=1576874 RepID=UPI001FEA9956|nr:replication initiation protein [Corynebacterium alimapuense]